MWKIQHEMIQLTDIILGMGEVGSTQFELLQERGFDCIGIDSDKSKEKNSDWDVTTAEFLHVCLPGELSDFVEVTLEYSKKYPNIVTVIVHSTVKPGTTKKIQEGLSIPVLYSPVRGIHKRFLDDVKRYTKFFSSEVKISNNIKSKIKARFNKVDWMSNTKTAEMAKILVDTTYYGWLINYAQITKMICDKEGIDYDEMWKFADEIHGFLGNRPKMFPGIIGGHCVIPNLNLIDFDKIQTISKINELFKKFKENL